MGNTIMLRPLDPELVKALGKAMVKYLSGNLKDFYTEALEKIDRKKTIKAILHDKGIRRESDLRDPAFQRYIKHVIEDMNKTPDEIEQIFRDHFITLA